MVRFAVEDCFLLMYHQTMDPYTHRKSLLLFCVGMFCRTAGGKGVVKRRHTAFADSQGSRQHRRLEGGARSCCLGFMCAKVFLLVTAVRQLFRCACPTCALPKQGDLQVAGVTWKGRRWRFEGRRRACRVEHQTKTRQNSDDTQSPGQICVSPAGKTAKQHKKEPQPKHPHQKPQDCHGHGG